MQGLQAITKMLIESPYITKNITVADVHGATRSGTTFTQHECDVVVQIANMLRPFAPKRVPVKLDESDKDHDGSDSMNSTSRIKAPATHFMLCAPIVIMANQVLRATGYHKFCRQLAPEISTGSLQALQLSAQGLYEVLGSSSAGLFDMHDSNNAVITNKISIKSTPTGKDVAFSNFFDLNKIRRICKEHQLIFRHRYAVIACFIH